MRFPKMAAKARRTIMLDRRRILQGGIGALGSLAAVAPLRALAQSRRVKVRYNEVVRSIFFGPAYVAITNGYFDEVGIDLTITTAQGGDKSLAALLANIADIALIGPETAIYVQNSDSPTRARADGEIGNKLLHRLRHVDRRQYRMQWSSAGLRPDQRRSARV
jgi:hypothetical protein